MKEAKTKLTPAKQRREYNKKAAQAFARMFVRSRETFGSDLASAARLLGMSPKTMKSWFKGSSNPQAAKFDKAARRAKELGYTIPQEPNYGCMAEGCSQRYTQEASGSLYCCVHAERIVAWGNTSTSPKKERNKEKYDKIESLVELGYSLNSAIRVAGYEGRLTKQAVSATLRRRKRAQEIAAQEVDEKL